MSYDNYIDLNLVTLEECEELHKFKNMVTIIEDGRIVDFQKEVQGQAE